MIKNITLFILMCAFIGGLQAQVIFSEDFNTNGIPTDWSVTSDATDGGWNVGTPGSLSSNAFPIPDNGSNVAASNDDGCGPNCDKGQDFLISPPLDFSTATNGLFLEFDLFFGKLTYTGITESAFVKISVDGGTTWILLDDLGSTQGWQSHNVDISNYQGMTNVLLAFHYSDGGGWLYGIAIDNVSIFQPLALDAEMAELNSPPFLYESDEFEVSGFVYNNGATVIESFDLHYSIDGGTPVDAALTGLNINALESYHFEHPEAWVPGSIGAFELRVWIDNVNGTGDLNPDNDELSQIIDVYEFIDRPNIIDEYIGFNPILVEVGNSSNSLDKPTDLDFYPILAKRELWVMNENNESSGGSTTTFYNTGLPNQDFEWRRDGNAWHFMALPTGIAFGDNGNFGSSPGIQDANHNNGTFTGPTLWSSDPDIYAQPSGGNGSHLDMLHGSPFSMGIAHEVDNVYWVFDGWNQEVVRYDFVEDHGPGNSDHDDGIIRRYGEYTVTRDGSIPSHLILDKDSGWLYFVNVGAKEVVRLDINSGNATPAALINEQLAEHSNMVNTTFETIITNGLEQPSGIEIIGNRLLVSDYANGDIIVYDMDNNFEEIHRIITGAAGITGLKVGPEGYIWYTNKLQNTIMKAEPSDVVETDEPLFSANFNISPNPTADLVTIKISKEGYTDDLHAWLTTLDGKTIWREKINDSSTDINLKNFPKGTYLLTLTNHRQVHTEKIILQ